MSTRQGKTTNFRILHHIEDIKDLHQDLGFHVPELPYVEVASTLTFGPAQEVVAGCLHQQSATNYPLPMIWVGTLSRVRLQDRCRRLFHLREERIILVGHHEYDCTEGTDAANTHDFQSHVVD